MAIKAGDIVAIRGDKRINIDGQCAYTENQLIMGKYVKHTGHGGVWTGKVERVQDNRALIKGGWLHTDDLEKIA